MQGQGELWRNFCTLRRQVWFSNIGYKYPEKVKKKKSGYLGDWKSSLCNINLSLKLGWKVRNFNNFYLSKITFEKTKKTPVMWFLAEYLITAWLEDEEPVLEVPCCSDVLYSLNLLSGMDCAGGLSFPYTISEDTTAMIQQEGNE